ncbi:hypothetical protein ACLNGX_19195 [Bacillus velezensis]|uniref:hypothetical protein n=1 Tax=Bacillus TaxID=1386 RepID=UPI00024589E7|nr:MULTISPECIES: hypothetical protein [Bacillus]AKF32660.1 hypothetical protein AAV29_19740 [Bacillus velezensis]MBI0441470.1 hypothetical protein [Bacillus velezensis]MDK4202997.1 hypothetical protein [Bacillus velezensis]MDX8368180.1 hypothetical protein [Bacillus velezensis]MDY7905915.1 hypothetical protein [Bacillus sp. AG1]
MIFISIVNRIDAFKALIKIGKSLIDINIPPTTLRAFYGETLLNKAILNANSYMSLIPKEKKDLRFLDVGTLVSISRNIIETHNVYNYLCEIGISSSELSFRMELLAYYQSKCTVNILKKLGFDEYDSMMQLHSNFVTNPENLSADYPEFNSLDKTTKRKIIRGKKPYLNYRIKRKMSTVNEDVEKGIYNLFSNSVHSFPLGMSNYDRFKRNNHLDNNQLFTISLEVNIIYLASIIKSYITLRKSLGRQLNQHEKLLIRKLVSDEYLKKWFENRKKEGKKFNILNFNN